MKTKKEIQLRLAVLKQQLQLIKLYHSSFEEELGKKGVEQLVNEILDEMIILRKKLKDEKF